jgi:hypothetical protein
MKREKKVARMYLPIPPETIFESRTLEERSGLCHESSLFCEALSVQNQDCSIGCLFKKGQGLTLGAKRTADCQLGPAVSDCVSV